ncbi:MAG TPA: hypothetical protein VMR77_04055 [Patescibacteria group bacterium]|jgi:hypothetical protein|nr:hypothetical protein [Patescibacteria group bacterium]
MMPKYDLEKIKFSIDSSTFNKAVDLYDKRRITEFRNLNDGYSAVVLGGNPYQVFVSSRDFDVGSCTCYLGVNDTLCKHMVAVAIFAVKSGKSLTIEDKTQNNNLIFSGKTGILTDTQLSKFKESVSEALRHIKSYRGPSKIWFSYQNSLEEGCNRLSALLSKLPAERQTAKLIVDLLLRLDKKLSQGGVDDSNGTLGGFMQEIVVMLTDFEKIDPECKKEFEKLRGRETSFGWEEPLL